MTTKSLTCSNIEKRVLTVSVIFLAVALGLYVYFVNQTVQNVVVRKTLEKEIAELSSDVSGMESEYMNIKNSITLNYAESLGFVESPHTLFVSKVTPTVSLTLDLSSAN